MSQFYWFWHILTHFCTFHRVFYRGFGPRKTNKNLIFSGFWTKIRVISGQKVPSWLREGVISAKTVTFWPKWRLFGQNGHFSPKPALNTVRKCHFLPEMSEMSEMCRNVEKVGFSGLPKLTKSGVFGRLLYPKEAWWTLLSGCGGCSARGQGTRVVGWVPGVWGGGTGADPGTPPWYGSGLLIHCISHCNGPTALLIHCISHCNGPTALLTAKYSGFTAKTRENSQKQWFFSQNSGFSGFRALSDRTVLGRARTYEVLTWFLTRFSWKTVVFREKWHFLKYQVCRWHFGHFREFSCFLVNFRVLAVLTLSIGFG